MFKYSFKFIFIIVIAIQVLYADNDKVEIKANHIESTDSLVSAKNNVVVYYGDSVIKASSASFNRKTKLLVLDGDIVMMGYKGGKEHAEHMEIQTDTKEVSFEELFLVSENDVWLYSDDVNKKEGNYTLGTSVLSSCDLSDPLWTMVFSNAVYDSNEKYMQIYDAKIYTDVKDAEKNPTNVLISKTKVTAKDKLVADLVSGGGYVVILMPVKEKK